MEWKSLRLGNPFLQTKCILFLIFIFSKTVESKQITYFDGFCEPEELYKPYLRYYRGRTQAVTNGLPFIEHPPGFHNDFLEPHMENTYVCINGLAILYYKLTTDQSVVFETPHLHKFVHHCMLVNGQKGPGQHVTRKILLAILLMGDPTDYRKPAIQLFNAPYQKECDPATDPAPCPGPIINSTSVLMMGDTTECILVKGSSRSEMRIRTPIPKDLQFKTPPPDPPIDNGGSFCKLSYQNMKDNVDQDAATMDMHEKLALEYLNTTETIKTKGCWAAQNYTADTHTIVTLRNASVTQFWEKAETTDKITKASDYLKDHGIPEDAANPGTNPVWPPDYDPNSPTDPCPDPPANPDKCSPEGIKLEVETLNGDLKTLKETDPPDAAAIATKTLELVAAKLIVCRSEAYRAMAALNPLLNFTHGNWSESMSQTEVIKHNLVNAFPDQQKKIDAAKLALEPNPTDTALQQAVTDAQTEYDVIMTNHTATHEKLWPQISLAESLRMTAEQKVAHAKMTYDKLIKEYRRAKGGTPDCKRPKPPLTDASGLINIKREDDNDKAQYLTTVPEDMTKFDTSDTKKTCGEFPKPIATCKSVKPELERTCQLLKASMNNFLKTTTPATGTPTTEEVTWKPEDAWRKDVLEIIEDIFHSACSPMFKPDYVIKINRVMKGYLIDFVYKTINRAVPDPTAPPPTTPLDEPEVLPGRRAFWDQIMEALKACKRKDIKLYFKRVIQDNEEVFLFIKRHPNGTTEDKMVEHFIEQADEEYDFNWIIDRNWRVVATVLGICMPAYEKKIPLITAKFFTHYTEDFLYPLAKEWVKNRDNPVLRLLFGEYFSLYGDRWSKLCMEASFIASSDIRYRPPRKLMVNQATEANFFISGPLAGTTGIYT